MGHYGNLGQLKSGLGAGNNVPRLRTNFAMFHSWAWRLQMGLGKWLVLENTMVLKQVKI